MDPRTRAYGIEWPTLGLVALTYGAWISLTLWGSVLPLSFVIPALAIVLTLHSSLQHEAVHGHPLPDKALSEALMTPGLGLVIPYGRFRDLHLAHHKDANLTDPHDDPESWYHDPLIYWRLPRPVRWVLTLNNTFVGRLVLGPLIGTEGFLRTEFRALRRGDPGVRRDWAIHLATVIPVLWWVVAIAAIPLWAYLLSCYLALSILRIRTFVEHQAHQLASGRSVIIEDRGPLALLFLNNNLHSVHHAHPQVAWYDLPALFRARRTAYLRRNRGYYFRSYWEVARRYFLSAKEPVPHPFSRPAE